MDSLNAFSDSIDQFNAKVNVSEAMESIADQSTASLNGRNDFKNTNANTFFYTNENTAKVRDDWNKIIQAKPPSLIKLTST